MNSRALNNEDLLNIEDEPALHAAVYANCRKTPMPTVGRLKFHGSTSVADTGDEIQP